MAFTRKYTQEQIETAVKNANCYSGVFRNLGLGINGGSYPWIKKLISKFNISVEHFYKTNENLKAAGLEAVKRKKAQIYTGKDLSCGRRINAKGLKSMMLFWNIKEECSICGLTEWRGVPIRLDIDHINSNCTDNRLENLRFLCPNCHRIETIDATKPYAQPKNEKVSCICGNLRRKESKMCRPCADKARIGK